MGDLKFWDSQQRGIGENFVTLQTVQLETTAISTVFSPEKTTGKSYRLDGTLAKADAKGIVIKDGKKNLRQ